MDATPDLVKDFIVFFTSILWEAMPFIVLGAVIAGILEEFLPQEYITKVIPRNRFFAIGISCLLGLVFPMCECGIIVVMRRLLRKGLPLSCCVAYMLAGPIINLIVMFSTYTAFSGHQENMIPSPEGMLRNFGGVHMALLRSGMGFLVAYGTAVVVEFVYRKCGPHRLLTPLAISEESGAEGSGVKQPQPMHQRIGNVTETALHDFVDITVFLILGSILSATVREYMVYNKLDVAMLAQTHLIPTILVMMLLGVVLCLCSEADAFVAASFVQLPPSAKLAFLVLGPMLDIKLFLMYTRVFRQRLIWTIVACTVIQVFVYSIAVQHFWYYWRSIHP